MNSLQIRTFSMAALAVAMLAVLFIGTALPAQAQTYTPLYAFGAIDSSQNGPNGQLALGRDGNFYGTITQDLSEIYQITPGGVETRLWGALNNGNSTSCYTGLTLGADGLLYGTCMQWEGFTNPANSGVIFKYDPSKLQNGFTILYAFPYCGTTSYPSQLTLGPDGNFYGTTYGGAYCGNGASGTFFKITPSGTLTMLHTFQGAGANEPGMPTGPLTLAANGNFYGTSQFGGKSVGGYNVGTVYKVTPKGKVTLLYSFNGSGDGIYPLGGVIQGADGKFYGTTSQGGASNDGRIFQMTAAGKIKYLHDFNPATDDAVVPTAPLTLGPDGNLYGADTVLFNGIYYGGPEGFFKITPKGVYTNLFALYTPGGTCDDQTANGCMLSSPLPLHPNGTFYGTTLQGGIGRGVFYSLSTGLKPYIILQFPQGKKGTSIGIFGVGLTGTNGVSFNGVAANFTVASDTYLTATIPTGAKTGYVTVSTPSGTLKSAVKLTVK